MVWLGRDYGNDITYSSTVYRQKSLFLFSVYVGIHYGLVGRAPRIYKFCDFIKNHGSPIYLNRYSDMLENFHRPKLSGILNEYRQDKWAISNIWRNSLHSSLFTRNSANHVSWAYRLPDIMWLSRRVCKLW